MGRKITRRVSEGLGVADDMLRWNHETEPHMLLDSGRHEWMGYMYETRSLHVVERGRDAATFSLLPGTLAMILYPP